MAWRRAPSRLGALLAAGLVVVAIAACSDADERAAPPVETVGSAEPSPVPSEPGEPPAPDVEPSEPQSDAEPAIEPMSAADYQGRVTVAADRIGRSLERLARARTFGALSTRVARAEATVSGLASGLASLVPPPEAATPHETLLRGVRRLANVLARTAEDVQSRTLCAAGPVMARLGAARIRRPLGLARRELAAAGFEVGALAPPRARLENRRLATGEYVVPGDRSGLGTLTVDNGLAVDALVVLSERKDVAMSMYVGKRDIGTIGGIPDGTYRVYFTLGTDWDGALGGFTRNCEFSRFDEPVTFETISTGGGVQFQTYTITLHGVVGGTASTSDVAPDSFPG